MQGCWQRTLLVVLVVMATMMAGVTLAQQGARNRWNASPDSPWLSGRARSHAGPDTFFIAFLDADGVPYDSTQDAIAQAHELCAGNGSEDAGARMQSLRPDMSAADATAFAAAAQTAYCPQQMAVVDTQG